METKFNLRSKKEDLLAAYNELVEKYTQLEKIARRAPQEVKAQQAEEKRVVEQAITYTNKKIIKDITDLKLGINQSLTDLTDKLTTEATALDDIQKAIVVQTRHLEELYDIQVAAGMVHQLIQEYEEKKTVFEADAAAQRAEWQKEQQAHDTAVQERNAQLKKEQTREQEEYEYTLKIARKKDKDAYDEKKAVLEKELKEKRQAQEKELAEREAAVAAKETELAELKARVETFPKELAVAVSKAEKEAVERAKKDFQHNADLVAKETEGKLNLAEQRIKTLEETVAKQAAQINTLSKQLQDATSQVQNIAVKAIEGASGVKALAAVNEIALEQAKIVREKK